MSDPVEIRTDGRRQRSNKANGPRRQVSVAVPEALPQGAQELDRDIRHDMLCGCK